MTEPSPERYQFFNQHPEIADFQEEIIQGLSAPEPYILPKYFYDETGSRLFEEICNTDEYYPTRTEVRIIRDNIDSIAATLGKDCLLIEPGSGDSYKVRLLLDALRPIAYLPIDISRHYLQDEAQKLATEFTWLNVHAVCADFTGRLELPYHVESTNRIAFFPGSTIGNFLPGQAVTVLQEIRSMVGRGGGLLIGVDLQKDPDILNAAYNDKDGFTEQFNKNLLVRINRELGADFNVGQYKHHAFFNAEKHRIEMHLVSLQQQDVTIDGHVFRFTEGQSILTEYSHKYTIESFQKLAAKAGFKCVKTWLDDNQLFSVFFSALSINKYKFNLLLIIVRNSLITHAHDDPFMTQAVLPGADELSSATTLEISAHGGHVGFISGQPLNPVFWLEQRIPEYLDTCLN